MMMVLIDVKARVAWTDGSDNIQSYLVYDMIIPADSTVETYVRNLSILLQVINYEDMLTKQID